MRSFDPAVWGRADYWCRGCETCDAAFEAETLDVGRTCFAHPQTVETEQHGQRCVIAVVLLRGEQEHAEFGAVHEQDRDAGLDAFAAREGGFDAGSRGILPRWSESSR